MTSHTGSCSLRFSAFRIISLVVVLFASISLLAQATYYVSKTGSDSNPGTNSQPWLTIQHAASTAMAGATVNVEGGVYNEVVNFTNSGTAAEPIVFQSYPVVASPVPGSTFSGTVSTSGDTVTWVSGAQFSTGWATPFSITINGSGYEVSAVNSATSLTVTTTPGTQTGVAYSIGITVQGAVIDGTGVSCCGSTGTQGLINMTAASLSYVTVSGFEIRNYTTSSSSAVPAGVWITGYGTGIQILNNLVHNITTTSEKNGNALGIAAYGSSTTPITQLVINGNEVYNCKTGNSETVNVDGNVTYFQMNNNIVHDDDNIGLDAIGYEGVGPVGYDEAMYGEISGNTIYNVSGIANAGEGTSYDADGVYCDSCAYVTVENNWIYNVDYGVELASEHKSCLSNGTEWSGPGNTGTPGTGTSPCYARYVTARNNVINNSSACGHSIGGYAASVGSSFDVVFVNNTLYNNSTQKQSGEYQIQHNVGSAQDNYFENNIVYAGTYNEWIYSFVATSTSYPAPPATLNYNLYYSTAGYVKGTSIDWDKVTSYTSFANFQSTAGEDGNSTVSNPAFESLTATPHNFDVTAVSPAVNNGGTSLSCSIGWCDPNGSSPSSIYGATDFLGNPRMTSGAINIGAYQVTGIASNTLAVTLTSGASSLNPGESTTLMVTVVATPGGGGAPSGTVNIMSGSTLLETATLLPTGVNSTAANMPLSASQLAAGANTLTAVYSGNTIGTNCCTATYPPGGATQVAWYPSATSSAITVTGPSQQSQTISCSNVPSSAAYNSTFTVNCTATSGLAVTYTSSGVCTNSGATYTMTSGTGSCSVIANQAGNSSYTAAPTVTNSVSATLANNNLTFTTPPPASAEYGSSFSVVATGLGTGAIAYLSDGVVCTNADAIYTMISGSGTCTVTATQAADSNYQTASASESVTAEPAQGSVSMALTSGTNPSIVGESVTFTATVTSDTGAVKGRRTTKRPRDLNGSVTWSANTGCASSGVSGNSPETATCTTSALAVGTNTVTATYTANDSNHTTANGSINQTVNSATNAVTFTTPAPANAEYGSSFSVAASGLGTGAITYTSDGVVCTNLGATYTMISGSGTCTVTATQAADSIYPAGSASESVTATPAVGSVSVALTSGSNPSNYGDSITFTATVTSDTGAVKGRRTTKRPRDLNGSVAWSGNTGCSASPVSGNPPQTATCTTSTLAVGTDTVTATYTASDSNHTTASGSINQTVNPATNTVTFTTPAPASAEYGSSFTVAASGLGTGAITYTSDGVVCTNVAATYTMISGSGTCAVTATQAADINYQTASASEFVTAAPAVGSVSVALTSGSNPSNYGDSITFTATVTSDTGAVKGRRTTKKPRDLNGSIAWSGNTGCSASSVSGNSPETATCTTSILPGSGGGTDTVTATYTAGDSNHTTASSSINQTVNPATNTVTFTTPAPASAEYGSSFTVAASGLGTGAITYTSDGLVCSNVGATYTMISGSGTCTVTASQAADGNYYAGSASEYVTAGPAVGGVSVALTSGTNPSTYGASVTFTASVTSDTGAVKGRKTTKRPRDLNGSVNWSGNTGCSASTVSANPPQTATCTTTSLPGGTDTVTATYTANDSNHTTGSGSVSQTVSATSNTVTFTAPAPASAEYGSSFTVAATGLGTGAISYTSDGVVCSNSGATYTMISGSGTCTVTATQAADNDYQQTSASEYVTAAPAVGSASVSLTSGLNPSSYGDSITFTATVTSDTGAVKGRKTTKRPKDLNGSVAWSANTGCSASGVSGNSPETATCTTSILNAGSNTVTATYTASDSNHTTASGSVSQTVNPANQTINVTVRAPATATNHSSFTVVASAQTSVGFTSSGYCTNVGATYTMTSGVVGKACTVMMNAPSSSNYYAAPQVTETATVAAAIAPTVSISVPTSAPKNSTYTVTATTNASTSPTFTATPATVCSISGNTVTMLSGTGSCAVKASWAADDTYKAATAIAHTTASKLAPTVTFTGAPGSAVYLSTFPVSTTENTSVTPTITSTTASVCSVSGGVVTMKAGTGTCTVEAKWAASADYAAASLEQTTTAELIRTTTTITNTVAGTNPLKVTVYFTVSNGTATNPVGSVTVTASSGETCTGTAAAGKCAVTFVSADAGSQSLTAVYAGNNNNTTSTSAPYGVTVP